MSRGPTPAAQLLRLACCLQEMQELERAQRAALEGLKGITREVASPSQQLVEQAAQCGRRVMDGVSRLICFLPLFLLPRNGLEVFVSFRLGPFQWSSRACILASLLAWLLATGSSMSGILHGSFALFHLQVPRRDGHSRASVPALPPGGVIPAVVSTS